MVKHTQTIRRQIADELFECVWPLYGIGAGRVKQFQMLLTVVLLLTIQISVFFYQQYLSNPANIYLFKLNKRNTGKWYESCPKLTVKSPERRYWHRSGVFIVNFFERILHLFYCWLCTDKSLLGINWWIKLIFGIKLDT